MSDSKKVDSEPITQFIDGAGAFNLSNETSITVSASIHVVKRLGQVPGAMLAAYGDIAGGGTFW